MAARSAEAVGVIAVAGEGVLSSGIAVADDALTGTVEFREVELDGSKVEEAARAAEVIVELLERIDSVALEMVSVTTYARFKPLRQGGMEY